MSENETQGTDLRTRAALRLKKKAEFRTHLFVYLVVNAALVVVFWGIGVIFHAQDVYSHHESSEEEIRREMERMH